MRPAAITALALPLLLVLLITMVPLAGCQRNLTTWDTNKTPGKTPSRIGTTPGQTSVVPATTSPFTQVTPIPRDTGGQVQNRTVTPPPVREPVFTTIDEKTLVFIYNETAYTYTLEDPPLLIEYTLTVPNITKTRVDTDPVTGSDRIVHITYPDPSAYFEVTVRDIDTDRIMVQDGYGGMYDVSYSKKLWVRYPGNYYIEFSGNRVTADIRFRINTAG